MSDPIALTLRIPVACKQDTQADVLQFAGLSDATVILRLSGCACEVYARTDFAETPVEITRSYDLSKLIELQTTNIEWMTAIGSMVTDVVQDFNRSRIERLEEPATEPELVKPPAHSAQDEVRPEL